jgi:hypothetical protein
MAVSSFLPVVWDLEPVRRVGLDLIKSVAPRQEYVCSSALSAYDEKSQ